MSKAFRVGLLLLLATLLGAALAPSSPAASPPLVLWVHTEEGRAFEKIDCERSCRSLIRKIGEAQVAPIWGRWQCTESVSEQPLFRAGARWQGRSIARFVPVGDCGRRQWMMVREIFIRHFDEDRLLLGA